MNIRIQRDINPLFGGFQSKSAQERQERQQKTESQVQFLEDRMQSLKGMQCDTIEDIMRKLDMFHTYEDQIAAAKAQYNQEQMRHALDEARELGEKIAEKAEEMKPKTAEERKKELIEEALGKEKEDSLMEELEEVTEEIVEAVTDDIEEKLEKQIEEIAEEELGEDAAKELSEEELAELMLGLSRVKEEELAKLQQKIYTGIDIRI